MLQLLLFSIPLFCVFSDLRLRAFNRILCRQASLRGFQVLDIRHGNPVSFESRPLMGKLDPTQHGQELSCTSAVRAWMPVPIHDGLCREATLRSCKHLRHPTKAVLSLQPQLRVITLSFYIFLHLFTSFYQVSTLVQGKAGKA